MPSSRLAGTSLKKPFASFVAIGCLLLSLVWMASCAFNVEAALARSGQTTVRPSHQKAVPVTSVAPTDSTAPATPAAQPANLRRQPVPLT